jgi:ribosomal protein S18 acetylase RimI-like enzyme
MNQSELLYLADQNLAEFCREQARWLPPFKVEERPHALFVASGTSFPAGPPNCVFPLEHGLVRPEQLLDEARGYYAPLGRGFSVYAPTHHGPELAAACEAAKWPKLSDAPGMVLEERCRTADASPEVEIKQVTGEATARDFITVSAEAYESIGMPKAVARKLLSQHARWTRPHIYAAVVYELARPVAAAMLLFSHGIAGVYWVGTLSDARGRGHATRIMCNLSNHGFDRGARCVVLQATQFGEPVYRKLGYREFTRYPWFLAPKP